MNKRQKLTRENWQDAVAAAINEFPTDLREKLKSRVWSRNRIEIKVKVPNPQEKHATQDLAVDVRFLPANATSDGRRGSATGKRRPATTEDRIEVVNQSDGGRLTPRVGQATVGDFVKAVQQKIDEELMIGGLITRRRDLRFRRFDGRPVCKPEQE